MLKEMAAFSLTANFFAGEWYWGLSPGVPWHRASSQSFFYFEIGSQLLRLVSNLPSPFLSVLSITGMPHCARLA